MPDTPSLSESAARKQAKKERDFYGHLTKYVVVMSGLVVLNWLTSPGGWWVIWPLLGWGFGLASHAAKTFGTSVGGDWVERRTRDLMGEEATDRRLRAMLDETLDARALPAGAPQDLARLQRRIEHVEAILTATDDPADVVPSRLDLDGLAAEPLAGADAAPRPRVR